MTVGLIAAAAHQAQAISLDYGSVGNAHILFNAATDTFTFVNSSSANAGFGFSINSGSGVGYDGSSLGLLGTITGTFTIGTITGGGVQNAPVTGPGTVSIDDGFGFFFTGTVAWGSIFTLGANGGGNNVAAINLTGTSYAGLNNDLLALNNTLGNQAVMTFGFGFVPAENLTDLTTPGGAQQSSFTGDLDANPPVSTPDGGATIGMLGLGMLALGAFRRKTA